MGTRCWFINWKFTSSHSIQVFDNTAKKNQNWRKKVKNHYVVTQTSSALQITQQKSFSWAPGEGLTRWPPCISQRAATGLSLSLSLSVWMPKNTLFLLNHQKVLVLRTAQEIWLMGKHSPRKILLLAMLLKKMKCCYLSCLCLTFQAMSQFCTQEKTS